MSIPVGRDWEAALQDIKELNPGIPFKIIPLAPMPPGKAIRQELRLFLSTMRVSGNGKRLANG